jgi:hypothetical protein
MYGGCYMFRHYMTLFGDLRSPLTTSLDTTRPSTIFYRLLLSWAFLTELDAGTSVDKGTDVFSFKNGLKYQCLKKFKFYICYLYALFFGEFGMSVWS